ncbi:MAG: hypothetical protein ABI992_06795 [Chthoniobacterales bacterium]
MLDRIRNSRWFRAANYFLLLGTACALSSCATKKDPPLLSDHAGGAESQIPWNQQEKWENQGQLGPLAEKLNSR